MELAVSIGAVCLAGGVHSFAPARTPVNNAVLMTLTDCEPV